MAVTRFDHTEVIAAGAGATNVTLPGPPIQDDVVVVFLVSGGAINNAINTSMTSIHNTSSGSPGYQSRYKVMTATPDTVVNVTPPAATNKMVVMVRVYRGLDVSTIPDNGATTSATNTSGMPDAPSYTTVTNGALVIAFGGLDDDDAASSVTAPSGYGNLLKADTGQGLTTDGATAMMADKIVTTAGAEDPAAFGGTGTDAWRAATWAVRVSAAGPITHAAGLATETDSAFAITRLKTRAPGLCTETDSALATGRSKVRALGLPSETDSAFAMLPAKGRAIGLATETDTAPPLGISLVAPIGLCTETDSAFAITRTKARAIGLAAEADSAFPVFPKKTRALGLASETDEAPSFGTGLAVTIGLATETDSAFAMTRRKTWPIGLAIELDDPLAFAGGVATPGRRRGIDAFGIAAQGRLGFLHSI